MRTRPELSFDYQEQLPLIIKSSIFQSRKIGTGENLIGFSVANKTGETFSNITLCLTLLIGINNLLFF